MTKKLRVIDTRCEFLLEAAGPHEGCAEFSAPETFQCGGEATVAFTIIDHCGEMGPGSGNTEETVKVCDEHASIIRAEGAVEIFFTITREVPLAQAV